MFDLDTQDFFVSRDVKFFEDIYPFAEHSEVYIEKETLSTANIRDVIVVKDGDLTWINMILLLNQ